MFKRRVEGVSLGQKVRDRITGYTGTIVAMTEWVNGCKRVTVQSSELKDGFPVEQYTYDIEQAEPVEAAPELPIKRAGGPRPNPTRQRTPSR